MDGRGGRRGALAAALVLLMAMGTAAVVVRRHESAATLRVSAIALRLPRLPPVPLLNGANGRALDYLARAQRTVVKHHPSCAPRSRRISGQPPDQGTPSSAMLDRFSVLRLPAPAGGPPPAPRAFGGVFVRYVRVAQYRYGTAFEVFPLRTVPGPGGVSAHCAGLELAALAGGVRQATPQMRARALRVGRETIADQRYIAQNPEGLCMAGGCEPFLYAQARGGLVSGGYGRDGSVWSYLVPDGVASVTAYYPALGPTQGFRHRIAAATAHARVINNVAVWAMPHEAGDIFPTTITWNAAGGEVLRTVYPT